MTGVPGAQSSEWHALGCIWELYPIFRQTKCSVFTSVSVQQANAHRNRMSTEFIPLTHSAWFWPGSEVLALALVGRLEVHAAG